MSNTTLTPTASSLVLGTYYIATNYNINPSNDAETNTENLQALVDTVNAKGGGTIYFPVGSYNFAPATNKNYSLLMRSNVSIIGENMEKTILKQSSAVPYTLFYFMGTKDTPITGSTYSNFTVDASATAATFELNADGSVKNPDTYPYYSKAFFYQYVRDCVFRDLILRDTIATALGVDCLDRVQIENVNCYNCGRGYVKGATGSSGIGIGTGGWENENFYIHNCTCEKSGQFGIFIENQVYLGWSTNVNGSNLVKGCIISNCITRNGRNKGIGIRGGKNVTVTGCESYENASDGFYIDGKCQNVKIHGCNSAYNEANGIYVKTTKQANSNPPNTNSNSYRIVLSNNTLECNKFDGIHVAPESPLSTLVIKDNVFLSNELKGIRLANGFTAPVIMGNYVSHNGPGLSIDAATYPDCVIKDNVIRKTVENGGNFTGFTSENELLAGRGTVIRIPYSSFTQGKKINEYGHIKDEEKSMLTGLIDISGINGNSFHLALSDDVESFRICQYNSIDNTRALGSGTEEAPTSIKITVPWESDRTFCNHVFSFAKYNTAKYVRIFISYKGIAIPSDFSALIFS